MGFLAKISALALAASVSVAAQDVDLDSINKSVDNELSQVDTNGKQSLCLLTTSCSVR